MSERSRLTEIPRDIQELIIYQTNPENFDTLCYSNPDILNLCNNPRIIQDYLIKHNIILNNQSNPSIIDFTGYLIDLNSTNSSILIKNGFKILLGIYEINFLAIGRALLLFIRNPYLNEDDMIEILESSNIDIYKWDPFSTDFADIKRLFGFIIEESITQNKQKIIAWLIFNGLFVYNTLVRESIKKGNNDMFDLSYKYLLLNERVSDINYQGLIDLAINFNNIYVFDRLLSQISSSYIFGGPVIDRIRMNFLSPEMKSILLKYKTP